MTSDEPSSDGPAAEGRADDPGAPSAGPRSRSWVAIGQRIGYALFARGRRRRSSSGSSPASRPGWCAVIEVCLFVGSVVLAPSIVLAYAVKAAERDDLEHGR